MKESVRKQLPDMIKRRPRRSPFCFAYLDMIGYIFGIACAAAIRTGEFWLLADYRRSAKSFR